jgi:hypothetical protein
MGDEAGTLNTIRSQCYKTKRGSAALKRLKAGLGSILLLAFFSYILTGNIVISQETQCILIERLLKNRILRTRL